MRKLLGLLLVPFISLSHASEQSWDELVAAAKREGKVVIMGPPDTEVRQALPAAFKARYGITVEYVGGRSSETAARLRAERSAGVYTIDVALSGIQTMATIFYREKMLQPIKPVLMPEILDGTKWKKGKPWFIDPEDQYILRLFNTTGPLFHINTSKVKPEEIRSAQDLVNPKWKGKIAAHDPTVPGTGSNDAARLYVQLGEPFVKQLYIDQQPMIVRDRRQLTDSLARGTYPIVLGAEDEDVERLRKDGLPLKAVHDLPDLQGTLSAGVGLVAMFQNAPHPNAAKLFVNWIASKEGLEVYSQARGESPTRNDIDEAKFLPAARTPRSNVTYFDTYDWDFTVTTKEKARKRVKELLRR